MNSPLRVVLLLLLAVPLLASGCAREVIFPFEPLEIEPAGSPFRIPFRLAEGEQWIYDFHYQAGASVMTTSEMRESSTEANVTVLLTCLRAIQGFGYELEARVSHFESETDGVRSGPEDEELAETLDRMSLRYRVTLSGKIAERRLDGLQGRRLEPTVERFLSNFIAQLFGRSEIYGRPVRIGARIISTEVLDKELLEGLVAQGVEESDPAIDAEMVLIDVRAVQEEKAAEFRLNAVGDVVQEEKRAGKKAKRHQGVKVTGSYLVSLASGMLIGENRMEVLLKGTLRSGGETADINSYYRLSCVSRRPDAPHGE